MTNEERPHQPYLDDVINGPLDELITHWTLHPESTPDGRYELVFGPETRTREFWQEFHRQKLERERRIFFGPESES